MANVPAFLQELAGSIITNLVEPKPLSFKRTDKSGIGPVGTGCKKPAEALHPFRSQLNRNAFLLGCSEFTHIAQVEHLIVGYGFTHGSTTVVESMQHSVGTEETVQIPLSIATAIQNHVRAEHNNEVLLFHNHPRNILNVVFDTGPLPSAADRRTLVNFHSDLTVLGKALMGGGRVKFYVGENGWVREFRTPDLLPILERVNSSAGKK